MPKRTLPDSQGAGSVPVPNGTTKVVRDRAVPVRVVIVTLDSHLAGAAERARAALARDIPGLTLSLHVAAEWSADPQALERCRADIRSGDIIVAAMLFMEDHIQAVLPDLQARRADCDAIVACISAGEVIRVTRLGQLDMSGPQRGPLALLKRLRGGRKPGAAPAGASASNSGAKQMAMLRRLPKILRFIPGTAQDLRAYFLTMQYWLAGSDENVGNMIRFLVDRYASGPRAVLKGTLGAAPPADYPEVGVYHPAMPGRISDRADRLPRAERTGRGRATVPQTAPGSGDAGTVGLLLMRSYVLGSDTRHYDGVIRAMEARGLRVVPAFAGGLDARPAVERFFMADGRATVDAVVSLTGFSLVGGPAYNDARAAEDLLQRLDVPYIAAHAVEFQSLDSWRTGAQGLMPVEATMMVAIPELDGATGPMVFGGRTDAAGANARDMQVDPERAGMLAARVARWIALRRAARAERRIAITLFNFPPNSGATGTAAHLSVFESLHNTLLAMRAEGYTVDVPRTVDDLRVAVLTGNASRYGADANVHARTPVDAYVRAEPHLAEIEAQWGAAPGRSLTDGCTLFILGAQFGNVFVGVQPPFGYEGDPMRLLFERGFTPTHAFSAYYRWLREDFRAHAVLHFGTHGALEFLPGKQTGMTAACWPDRLIGDLPNLYLYAANNPSEGLLAKRRAAATLVSHLTPPVTHAGLYKDLGELRASLDRWRGSAPDAVAERSRLEELIQAQAAALDLAVAEPAWNGSTEREIAKLADRLQELEETLIPHGLHVVGRAPGIPQRTELLTAIADAAHGTALPEDAARILAEGGGAKAAGAAVAAAGHRAVDATVLAELARLAAMLAEDFELAGLIRAMDGRFVPPVSGGDLLRSTEILPTGRNLHGFDPFRIPSAFAVTEGRRQAAELLKTYMGTDTPLPKTVAIVLWGTDNLKSEGGPIAQALALMGAVPRFDSYGRLCGAALVPLEELGRPRIDVLVTLSGIFRDLLPLQTRMLAEAAFLAASAEEPDDMNFVRRHALAYQEEHGCDLQTASIRVFSNADGAYGSNVNQLIDSGAWSDEDELAEAYSRRKCFAYGIDGKPTARRDVLNAMLAHVDLAFQNVDSVELGVTTIDHYFDTLGGIGRAVQRAKGTPAPVFIGDQTRGTGTVRTLAEQVALETRTRLLNPKWYEGMLEHGYEGVRQIEAHVTNTMGWSATTGGVAPWIYQRLTETYVLDDAMRRRVAALNPKAAMRVADRLLEAHERQYWTPDPETLAALRRAGEELEDRLEGAFEHESPSTPAAAMAAAD